MARRSKSSSPKNSKRDRDRGETIRHVDPVMNRPANADEQPPETLVPDVVRERLSSTRADDGAERTLRIAQRAYELAEARGFAPGRELDDWLQAEREIDENVKQAPPDEQFTG